MEFSTDSYIEIGKSHNICEDYAIHGTLFHESIGEKVPYIIVCDGCSNAKESDFGARILAHSCRQSIFESYYRGLMSNLGVEDLLENIKTLTLFNAMKAVNSFNLPFSICDATLLFAFVFREYVYVTAIGDGNIIIKRSLCHVGH